MGLSLVPFLGFIDLSEPDGVELRFRYLDQTHLHWIERLDDLPLSHMEAFQEGGHVGVRRKGENERLAFFKQQP